MIGDSVEGMLKEGQSSVVYDSPPRQAVVQDTVSKISLLLLLLFPGFAARQNI